MNSIIGELRLSGGEQTFILFAALVVFCIAIGLVYDYFKSNYQLENQKIELMNRNQELKNEELELINKSQELKNEELRLKKQGDKGNLLKG